MKMKDITNRPLICIVDDELTNAEMMRLILDDEYDTCLAYNGKEAIDVISSRKPDLILLDIVLPDLSGYEVCKALKKNPETENIPIIFVTGLEDKKSESIGLEAGAIDYVVKPVVSDIVKTRIQRILQTDLYIEFLEKSLDNSKKTVA